MRKNLITYILGSLLTLGEARKFNFNVISIMGDSVSLAVKYGDNLVPLTTTYFPGTYVQYNLIHTFNNI